MQQLLRQLLLTLARIDLVKRVLLAVPATRGVVLRFVPGEELDEAVESVRDLQSKGLLVSVDSLGEDTLDLAMADAVTASYIELLDRLERDGLADRAEVSLKLSAVGQFLGADGEQIALANARKVCAEAERIGTTVTLDMEDHTTTDSTLRILAQLREDYPRTGCVLQAYLFRTEDDARALAAIEGQRVRLCKGAYNEPAEVAYQSKDDVDRAYVRALRILMEGVGYPMVATHDPRLVTIAQDLAQRAGRDENAFEFQMLYGIRPVEQERLASLGYRVRVYMPFGSDWYGYLTRRLAERPANLMFFLRSFVSRR